MNTVIAPPASSCGSAAQALFQEARRRRRRRWLAGIAVVVAASAAVAMSAVRLHRAPGREAGRTVPADTAMEGRSLAAVVWFDGIRLYVGGIHLGGRVIQRAVAEVNADFLPLVQADGRVYWVDPAGSFVPALGHWSQLVMYLNVATGRIGIAGAGQTVFLSADGRYLLMSQTATSLTQTPVTAAGAPRQLTLPRGWYMPGGDGLPDLFSGEGFATANGIIVQSQESQGALAPILALWNPRSGKVEVIGRGRAVIDAYTPPGAHYSLLAWLPAACRFPSNCLLKITNTATLSTRAVRSPLRGGFALGGAFSPSGTQLAVFLNTSGWARLALVNLGTGTMRVAPSPWPALGQDIGWARWLPDGLHLVVGAGTGGYLVDAATLSAQRLFFTRGHDHYIGNSDDYIGGSQDINFTAAIVPPAR